MDSSTSGREVVWYVIVLEADVSNTDRDVSRGDLIEIYRCTRFYGVSQKKRKQKYFNNTDKKINIITKKMHGHVHMYVCTYVCMYICMYVCTYVCMYICMYVHMYVCMYICMYVCMYVCMYICMYVHMYVCTYVCMYICMYVHMYVCTYVCIAEIYQLSNQCSEFLFGCLP